MKVISNLLASAAILAAGVANAGNLEVTHWWTSGGEAAAVSVLAENLMRRQIIHGLMVQLRAAAEPLSQLLSVVLLAVIQWVQPN